MGKSVLVCLLVVNLAAACCDKKRGVLEELESITGRLCACSSKACAEAAMADFSKLGSANRMFKPGPAEEARAIAALERLSKCDRAFPESTTPRPRSRDTERQCGDKPCLPVPNGIKGLAFGMSVKDVSEALGIDDSTVVAKSPRRIAPLPPPRDPIEAFMHPEKAQADAHAIPLPGSRAVLETTVGKRPATCSLDFSDSEQLVGIYCSIEWSDDEEFDERFFSGLREQLTAKYGRPTVEVDERQIWRSDSVVLECSRDSQSAHLNSFTTAHEKLVAETLERAELAIKRAADAAKSDAERAAEAKEAALREGLRALESDTSSAAERANPGP